jgi:hypothetical protein
MDSSTTTAERKDNRNMAGTFLFAAPTSLLRATGVGVIMSMQKSTETNNQNPTDLVEPTKHTCNLL